MELKAEKGADFDRDFLDMMAAHIRKSAPMSAHRGRVFDDSRVAADCVFLR